MKNLYLKIVLILLISFSFNYTFSQGRVLSPVIQRKSAWCWAACLQYFIPDSTQCSLVKIANSRSPTCNYECNDFDCENCNQAFVFYSYDWRREPCYCLGGIEYFFDSLKFNSKEHTSPPSWLFLKLKLQYEDIILFTSSKSYTTENNTTGHFVIANKAYNNSGQKFLRILDPWPVNRGRVYDANLTDSLRWTGSDTIIASIQYFVDNINSDYQRFELEEFGNFSSLKPNASVRSNNSKVFVKNQINCNPGSYCANAKAVIHKIDIRDVLSNNYSSKTRSMIYQFANENGKQYLLQKKKASMSYKYFRNKNLFNRINPFSFWVIDKIFYNFSYLSEYQLKGKPLENIDIKLNDKTLFLGGKGNLSFKIIEYEFLQTWFYVFEYKGEEYVFFESKETLQLISDSQLSPFVPYRFKDIKSILEKKTKEEINKLPKGGIFSL